MEWFYWFLFGFAAGGSVLYILNALKAKEIVLKWYEWVMGGLTLLILVFLVETFVHSLQEMQVKAAWLSVLFLIVPAIILSVITARSVMGRLAK